MNDLEICQRIAEIEGIHVSNAECGMYDPLTDKALCFDLMVKYQVSIEPQPFNLTYAKINYQHAVLDENLQRAICLTIIEAYKG